MTGPAVKTTTSLAAVRAMALVTAGIVLACGGTGCASHRPQTRRLPA